MGDAIKMKFLKKNKHSKVPTYGRPGDSGMDLYVDSIISETAEQIEYGFGIFIELPEGYDAELRPRSSIKDRNISLSNSPGTIDWNYRGELMAVFYKNDRSLPYKIGERAAQLVISKRPIVVEFEEVFSALELGHTERGINGYGSSGND